MKTLVNKLFDIPDRDRRWSNIILWWEIRRIPYNLILLLSGIITLLVLSIIIEGLVKHLHIFPFIIFALMANIFYTGGWIVELALKLFSGEKFKYFGRYAFMSGLAFSVVMTFSPLVLYGVGTLILGEGHSSLHSHFTRSQPGEEDIVGHYRLDLCSIKKIGIQIDSDTNFYVLNINADHTFDFINVPIFDTQDLFKLCSGSGTWELKKSSFDLKDVWIVGLDFNKTVNSLTGKEESRVCIRYYLCDQKPPYRFLLIIGDPGAWNNMVFEKRE